MMNPDYVILAVVAVFGIGLGLYTLREARKYRVRQDLLDLKKRKEQDRAGCHCCYCQCGRTQNHLSSRFSVLRSGSRLPRRIRHI